MAKYDNVDVGDPFKTDSGWCDDAFEFDYSRQKGPEGTEGPVTFRKWFENQTGDGMEGAYGRCIMVFAARWARRVENALEQLGEPDAGSLGLLFETCSREADESPNMGISGFQYGAAVSTLHQTWKYGEVLRLWSNGTLGNADAKGVLNPALVSISIPESA